MMENFIERGDDSGGLLMSNTVIGCLYLSAFTHRASRYPTDPTSETHGCLGLRQGLPQLELAAWQKAVKDSLLSLHRLQRILISCEPRGWSRAASSR
jgi:hypothetical protein